MIKNIKIQYSTHYNSRNCHSVPKIQMEGKWLEELGFSIGDIVAVEYENGCIRIRPLTSEEQNKRQQEELKSDIRRKSAALKSLQSQADIGSSKPCLVAESGSHYSEGSSVSV